MRAIAILSVVFSHFLWVYPDWNNGLTQLLIIAGFMGVEIFFVLSGFLIGGILYRLFVEEQQGGRRLGYFLIRRWFRTLPNYYLILLVNLGIWIYFGRELPDYWTRYFYFFQNGLSGMPIFFTESWSLPIEEFAYVIGPVLLLLCILLFRKRYRKRSFLLVTLAIILFFFLTKVWYNQNQVPNSMDFWNVELRAVVLYRIDAIYYGVLFAFLSRQFGKGWVNNRNIFFLLGLALFMSLQLSVAFFGFNSYNSPILFNVFYLPICSLSVALTLPWFSSLRSIPASWMRSITWISLISYSMYLLHYSIILQLMRYFLMPDEAGPLTAVFMGLGYIVLTAGLSYGLFRLYEKPMMDLRDHPSIKRIFYIKN